MEKSNDAAKLNLQHASAKEELDKVINEIENVNIKIANWQDDVDQAFPST